ncbi:MAG TPA: hypothetical protein VMT20_14770 [Terriglobia bacterium]|nr:hypothetical protein [Terriglobia bacterium]
MDVAAEISTLRKWLREDETRLQTVSPRFAENVVAGKLASTQYDFNDHSNFYNGGQTPDHWKNFSNWTNGG